MRARFKKKTFVYFFGTKETLVFHTLLQNKIEIKNFITNFRGYVNPEKVKNFRNHRDEYIKAGTGKKDFASAIEDVDKHIENPIVKY